MSIDTAWRIWNTRQYDRQYRDLGFPIVDMSSEIDARDTLFTFFELWGSDNE